MVSLVNEHKFKVMGRVNDLVPPAAPMSDFEKSTIDLQRQQLLLQQQEVDSKKEEALAAAEPVRKSVLEKFKELDEDLEQICVGELVTGEDQFVSRVIFKLSDWRCKLDTISSLFQDFQTRTAVNRMPEKDHNEVNAAYERTKTSLTSIVSVAEDQDLKRQLFSLDTSVRGSR